MRPTRLLLVLFAAGALSACSGPREAPPEPGRPAEPRTPVTRTVDGFRIQVYASEERTEAHRQAARAETWWENLAPAARPRYLGDDALTVEVQWRPPYYRVRLGAFATRAEAERALPTVRNAFGEAFIVPDVVTVTR